MGSELQTDCVCMNNLVFDALSQMTEGFKPREQQTRHKSASSQHFRVYRRPLIQTYMQYKGVSLLFIALINVNIIRRIHTYLIQF